MKRFSVLVAMAIMVVFIMTDAFSQQAGLGRITLLLDSKDLSSSITQLYGKVDTLHSSTGGYGRGFIQSLSLVNGDSLIFYIVADTPSTAAAANGITPRYILEARTALDSLASTGVNNRGYVNRYAGNPWTRASFDTAGALKSGGAGVQDTVYQGAFALKNLNKTGQIEYRIRTVIADSGTSTTRVINVRWKIYGYRPW